MTTTIDLCGEDDYGYPRVRVATSPLPSPDGWDVAVLQPRLAVWSDQEVSQRDTTLFKVEGPVPEPSSLVRGPSWQTTQLIWHTLRLAKNITRAFRGPRRACNRFISARR